MTDDIHSGEDLAASPAVDSASHVNPLDAPMPASPPVGGGDTPAVDTRAPVPYERFKQGIDARRAAEAERDQLRAQIAERDAVWQSQLEQLRQSYDSRDPVAALREALMPAEEEDPDPLVRQLNAEAKRREELEKKIEAMDQWRAQQEQQSYQRYVGDALTGSLNALANVPNEGKAIIHKAVLTDLISLAENGRPVTAEVIQSFVNSYAKPFTSTAAAPPTRPATPPAESLMPTGQSAVAPRREPVRNLEDAAAQIDKLLGRI